MRFAGSGVAGGKTAVMSNPLDSRARIPIHVIVARRLFGRRKTVRTFSPELSKSVPRSVDLRRPPAASADPVTISSSNASAAGIAARMAAPRDVSGRRLIADQAYFGLEAKVLRGGAARTLARLSSLPAGKAWIDLRSLGEDFHLDAGTTATLLTAMLSSGLLYPDGAGRYHPTRQFREYALATVVAPLARERAKALIDRACKLAGRINAEWSHLPFQDRKSTRLNSSHESESRMPSSA